MADPIPRKLPKQYRENIIGIEGALWTEYVRTSKKAEFQLFPRLIAIAERSWSAESAKNWNSFLQRIESILKTLREREINYANLKEANPPFWKKIYKYIALLY